MMILNIRTFTVILALIFATHGRAAEIDLTGIGYVTYGDAQSYSLPIANLQQGYDAQTGPFTIASSPGQISDLVVLASGTNNGPLVQNFDGMDRAYETPEGVSGETFFYGNELTYRGTDGTVANNLIDTWDSSVSAMNDFLAGEDMVFFFNNNQVNSGGTSLQSLAAWMRIWVTDDLGNVLDNSTFELSNQDSPYNLVSQGGGGEFLGDVDYVAPGAGSGDPSSFDGLNDETDFVLSGGQICVATVASTSVPIPVACDAEPGDMLNGEPILEVSAAINHNLGANNAAYAVVFPELNALLASLDGILNEDSYTMHVDLRLGCDALAVDGNDYGETELENWMDCGTYNLFGTELNNGYEQLFLGRAITTTTTVPEPMPLALLGLGLLLLGISRYHRS